MAKRPVFVVTHSPKDYVEEIEIEFDWYPGFSISQKQKSISSLHENFKRTNQTLKTLEISSKSPETLGTQLSAFHLKITTEKTKQTFSVETAFQSSKVFEKGGPYRDLISKTPKDAKRDPRLKNSGKLLHFNFFGKIFELQPKTLFYDWLYINALSKQKSYAEQIIKYDAFTDIEFNPEKSINCQARSAALFVSLHRRELLNRALFSLEEFRRLIYTEEPNASIQQLTFDF